MFYIQIEAEDFDRRWDLSLCPVLIFRIIHHPLVHAFYSFPGLDKWSSLHSSQNYLGIFKNDFANTCSRNDSKMRVNVYILIKMDHIIFTLEIRKLGH